MAVAGELSELNRPCEAERVYREVLDAAPQNSAAHMGLGYLARRKGDHAGALAHFEMAGRVEPAHAAAALEAAAELRELGRLDHAEALYQEILIAAPTEVAALIGLGQVARQRGDRAKALQEFERALAACPAHVAARLEVAAEYRHNGRHEMAESLCRRVLETEPNSFWALVALGQLARDRNDHAAALSWLEQASRANPRHLGVKQDLALAALKADRLDEAEAALQTILHQDPGNMRAHMDLGYLARRRGDHGAALSHFTIARDADPTNAGASIEAAAELIELGRPAEAECIYKSVLAEVPGHARTLVELGKLTRRRGDRGAALALFETAAREDPGCASALVEIADELSDRARYDEAESKLRAVLARLPDDIWALMGLGRLARKRGDHASALTFFEQAAAVDLRLDAATIEIASTLRELGRLDEARRMIEGLIARAPDNTGALMHRGYIERQSGAEEVALATFGEAHRRNPCDPQPLIDMALSHRALGDPAASLRRLHQALAIDPHHLWATLALADLALAAREFDQAKALCERGVATHPEHLSAWVKHGQVLAAAGETGAALEVLKRAEAAFAGHPDIVAERFHILCQAGLLEAASAVRAGIGSQAPHSFWFWARSVQLDLDLGDLSQAADALQAPPRRQSPREAARVAALRGALAEAHWRPDEAAIHYGEAIRLDPRDPWLHQERARACLLALDVEGAWRHMGQSLVLDQAAVRLRGQSMHVSQTHLGQLIDEFRLDTTTLSELQALRNLPPEARIAPLCEMVCRVPDHTPSAMQLMIALRQAGRFRGPPAQQRDTTEGWVIPRRIVQFWDSSEPPDDIKALMRSWKDFHPDFECRLFDDRAARAYLRAHCPIEVRSAYEHARYPSAKADLIRLAYLHAEGGFYADADDRCNAPLMRIVPSDAALVLHQDWYGALANNFIGAVPGNSVLKRALDLAVIALNRSDSDIPWLGTGPGVVTRAFAQLFTETAPARHTLIESCVVVDRARFKRAVGPHMSTTKDRMNKIADPSDPSHCDDAAPDSSTMRSFASHRLVTSYLHANSAPQTLKDK